MAETFKARMRRIRVRAGFKSQADAAQAIGCERGTVSMWEAPSSAVNAVSEEYLFKVAKAYRVSPQWINAGGPNDGFDMPAPGAIPATGSLKSDLTKKHPKAVRDLRPSHRALARAMDKLLGTLTDDQASQVSDLIYKFAGANIANEGEPAEAPISKPVPVTVSGYDLAKLPRQGVVAGAPERRTYKKAKQ